MYLGSYWCLNMGNLNMLKERKPQGCLTKGCYAGCHTRWRGLESYLFPLTYHLLKLDGTFITGVYPQGLTVVKIILRPFDELLSHLWASHMNFPLGLFR